MSESAALAAIRSHFAAAWTVPAPTEENPEATAPWTPVAWPGVSFTPPEDAAWVRFHIAPAHAHQASLGATGSRLFRGSGLIFVQCFAPLGAGSGEAEELAEAACAVFRGRSLSGMRFSGPRGESPRVHVVGNDGAYYQAQMIAHYSADAAH